MALKKILSVLALLVTAGSAVTAFGPFQVPAGVSELLIAGAALLAYLGYQPIHVPAQVSKVCAVLSVMSLGFVGSHAVAWGDGKRKIALLAIGFAGALLGALARGPQGRTGPPSDVPVPATPPVG